MSLWSDVGQKTGEKQMKSKGNFEIAYFLQAEILGVSKTKMYSNITLLLAVYVKI